jgi:hypothetical protein
VTGETQTVTRACGHSEQAPAAVNPKYADGVRCLACVRADVWTWFDRREEWER